VGMNAKLKIFVIIFTNISFKYSFKSNKKYLFISQKYKKIIFTKKSE